MTMLRLVLQSSTLSADLLHSWIEFNLVHARQHGWESFIIQTNYFKDDTTEIYLRPPSMYYKGGYIFEGSVSELQPNGIQMNRVDAVSLSLQRWSPTRRTGSRPDLFAQFEKEYLQNKTIISKLSSKL